MKELNIVLLVVGSFLLGMLFDRLINDLLYRIKNNKLIKDINNQFIQILDNVKDNKSKFTNRVNNTVFIKTNLVDYGDVNIVYLMDKKDICVYRESKCLYTSNSVDRLTLDLIISEIDLKHYDKIHDVVEILGFTFSREDFEKTFNIKAEDLRKMDQYDDEDENYIGNIISKNDSKLNMDDILDKINRHGIDKLSIEEKEFLKNYNK